MIPLETWLTLFDQRQAYLKQVKTALPEVDPIEIANLGPPQTGVTGMPHTAREWYVSVTSDSQVGLYGLTNGVWVFQERLFDISSLGVENIVRLDWDFDQNSSPVVFAETASKEIYGWFPNLAGDFEIQKVADGTNLSLTFDYPENPDSGDSDLVMFYKTQDNELAYAYQRDRYVVPREVGIGGPDLIVGGSGVTIERRVQVEYSGVDLPVLFQGQCQRLNPIPTDSFQSRTAACSHELPTGKVLVGTIGGTLVLYADYAAFRAGTEVTSVPTEFSSGIAVIHSDANRTLVAMSADESNEALNTSVAIYEVTSSNEINLVSTTQLFESESIIDITFGNGHLYVLVRSIGQPTIYGVPVSEQHELMPENGETVIDDLTLETTNNARLTLNSLAYRNGAFFMVNHFSRELYQIDLVLKSNNCRTLLISGFTRAGLNISFNNNQTELWSVEQASTTRPFQVYALGV